MSDKKHSINEYTVSVASSTASLVKLEAFDNKLAKLAKPPLPKKKFDANQQATLDHLILR